MIPGRNVVGDLEGGLGDQSPIEINGLGPVLQLAQGRPVRAVLELDPHIDRRAVPNVHRDRAGLPRSGDRIRRKDAAPSGEATRVQRLVAAVERRGVHAEGSKDGPERLGAHRDVTTTPVPELGRHPVGGSQLVQVIRRLDHLVIQAHGPGEPVGPGWTLARGEV